MKLNWGCGPVQPPEWTNSDQTMWSINQDHHGQIQDGLPWPNGSFDLVVSHHALQMLAWPELVPALAELRRVTRVGGVVRVSVPDLLAAMRAWQSQRHDYFQIDDRHVAGIDGKLCMYVSQAGATRSVFTEGWLVELMARAGFRTVARAHFRLSPLGPAAVTELDTRPDESAFVEGLA